MLVFSSSVIWHGEQIKGHHRSALAAVDGLWHLYTPFWVLSVGELKRCQHSSLPGFGVQPVCLLCTLWCVIWLGAIAETQCTAISFPFPNRYRVWKMSYFTKTTEYVSAVNFSLYSIINGPLALIEKGLWDLKEALIQLAQIWSVCYKTLETRARISRSSHYTVH